MFECEGTRCQYWHRYYETDIYRGGHVPRFSQTPDEYCEHPVAKGQIRNIEKNDSSYLTGLRVSSLRACPKGQTSHDPFGFGKGKYKL